MDVDGVEVEGRVEGLDEAEGGVVLRGEDADAVKDFDAGVFEVVEDDDAAEGDISWWGREGKPSVGLTRCLLARSLGPCANQ